MRRITCAYIFAGVFILANHAAAQSGAAVSQGGAGHAASPNCVILKRMGAVDQVASRVYSFGFREKEFEYVEGNLPDGLPFQGTLTNHDVRNLQKQGAQVIIIKQNYSADELKQARQDCTPASKTRNQGQATPVAVLVPVARAAAQTKMQVTSNPAGADIEIDGNFVGNTPSTVGVTAGQHQISVKKSGFQPWERKMSISTGQINVNAVLESDAK